MADGWHHDATGKAVRALIHRVSSALYDAKYPAENLGHLGAAAVYSVQHGNGVYLAAAAWALLQIVGGDKLIIPFC